MAALAATLLVWPAGTPSLRAEAGPIPGNMWWAPSDRPASAAKSPFATAVDALGDDKAAQALPVFMRAVTDPVLGGYARLYVGRAQLALDRAGDAAIAANALLATKPTGYLAEAALWLAAQAAEASRDWRVAIGPLQKLAASQPLNPERVYLHLGRAALNAGDPQLAYLSFAKVYYEFALTPEADDAAAEIVKLTGPAPPSTPEQLDLDLGRAEKLFGARRYLDARKAYDALRLRADRAVVALRIAECDFFLKHYAAARDALRVYLDKTTTRVPEAEFYYFSTLRELGRLDEYVVLARAFIDATPDSPLAEEALNNLGTHYVLMNDDATAAQVLSELYRKYPTGAHADRAAWRAGWWAFKTGDYATAISVFESAATTMRHADYRPSWLYWAARAHARLRERDVAVVAFNRVIADYRNSYYGRQAIRERDRLLAGPQAPPGGADAVRARQTVPPPATATPAVPARTTTLIRNLLVAGLYDDALYELRKTQLEAGTSPALEATMAYALNRKGELRLGITAMRRAYPQFLAEGGEALPAEILAVIFPVAHWDLVQQYALLHKLDPYLMAALIVQESTFETDAHSAADAWGLMQVLPSTGRQYAQMLGIRPFGTKRLTNADTNLRIGMAYFADLVKQFGGIAPALAAYNAGEQRAARWLAERPGIDQDEFIDDIPFPETQSYVRRIIGQAEDYRHLYRDLKVAPAVSKSLR